MLVGVGVIGLLALMFSVRGNAVALGVIYLVGSGLPFILWLMIFLNNMVK